MSEIKEPEINEVKKTEPENFKNIKPNSEISPSEAKKCIDDKFAELENRNQYYDDSGNLYREGKELLPNCEYELNGYKYETDNHGRIISAEGKLQMKDHDGYKTIKDSKHDIGKGDELATDDRGHLIGDQFNGSETLGNLVPQDAKINQTDYRELENNLAKEVNEGKDVRVKVEPIYAGDSRRPTHISYTYSIDGKVSQRIFPNGKG